MKNLRVTFLLILLIGVFTVADARPRPRQHHRHRPPRNLVSTPLDGGLLSILGVAGVAYYLTRKKTNKKES